MAYKTKGKCVYKKDTGKKVGCTKGSVKKYLAALHANVNESNDWGWVEEIVDDRKGYIITFSYPWRINNEITAKRLYDALVKRGMNAQTGSVYDEEEHEWEDLDYEFREYLDAYEEKHDELPVHIPKEFWFDKEYWDLSELTIERSETEIKEIYVYPDNGIALNDTEFTDMFLNRWAQTNRNFIPTIDAREVFPELYNVNESDLGWIGDVPIMVTKKVSEWYRTIDELKELVNVGDIVYLSGFLYHDGGGGMIHNREFRIKREIRKNHNIVLTALHDIWDDSGLALSANDTTQLGEFGEDYDLEMTVLVGKNLNESDLGWINNINYDEERIIINYIKTEMSDMLREYYHDIIFIELEDRKIIHIWTMGFGGEDYDMAEIEVFSEWSELKHNYDITERNIDEYMENIENDMAFMNEVHRLKKKYVDKLNELVPVRRTYTFENIY